MKKHEWVDGKLLQTNKKYSQLKLKQKERIHEWMYTAFRDSYKKTGRYPGKREDEEILDAVIQKIISADIWIPEYEVVKHYKRNGNELAIKELEFRIKVLQKMLQNESK